ncbi:MAG: uracil-DNA glycosylase [Spirochaetales bacterium]
MFALNADWYDLLEEEFEKDYFLKLSKFLKEEYATKNIYPPKEEVFSALNLLKLSNIKVVIIGQDPYHQKGQAQGLCFSVKDGVQIPPSLQNIYKELNTDLGCYIPNTGNLTKWARQGVLLLNTVLTVEDSKPNSHRFKGWENFTLEIIKKVNAQNNRLVFLLWGNNAKDFKQYIDLKKHLVLTAPHPSPLSAYSGFMGCKHFSKTNEFLKVNGQKIIDWQIENI